jgi:hypothetical protein
MITLNLERHDGPRMTSQSTRQEDPLSALNFLVQAELAFGARITDLSSTRLRLETQVCGVLDVTELLGSEEEMRSLVDMANCYELAMNYETLVTGGAAEDYCRLMAGRAAYSGTILNLGAPMFIGASRLRLAVMLALGYRDEADLALASRLTLAELMTVFELLNESPGTGFGQLVADLGLAGN